MGALRAKNVQEEKAQEKKEKGTPFKRVEDAACLPSGLLGV